MLAPNPTNRLHCQHSPTARFESKRAAHQAQWQGVNFGRRYPRLGGQNCTPNNNCRHHLLARAPLDSNYKLARMNVSAFLRVNGEAEPQGTLPTLFSDLSEGF